MDALDERIRALETTIKGYEAEYATASPEDKRQLRDLITAARQNLTELEKRKTAATAGIRS
jgi:phage shock protein A